MTTVEFDYEFDIAYNNLRSNSAPGIDSFEKSYFLTKAQEQIVLNYFDSKSNRKLEGFEKSEKRRRDLEKLIVNHNQPTGFKLSTATDGLGLANLDSYFVEVPDDVLFIISENAIVDGDSVRVIPVTHDEIRLQESNPFRKPGTSLLSKRAWRIDNSLNIDNWSSVEIFILKGSTLDNYTMRYIKQPQPIILANFNTEFSGQNLSIDGINVVTECELNPSAHRQVLDRAIELAIEAYEKQRIQSFPIVAARNE